MKKIHLVSATACIGVAIVAAFTLLPSISANRTSAETQTKETSEHPHEEGEAHSDGKEEGKAAEGVIRMSSEQVLASKIDVLSVGPGTLSRRLSLPGVVIPDRNRVGRVAAKVIGTVAELKKRLGEPVEKGELIAILDSREVADAKSEFIASRVNLELQSTLFQREETLWKKQVTAEQRLLRARTTNREAELRVELARQKLSALGISDAEIEALKAKGDTSTGLERYQVRSPIGGRVVEQLVDLGTPVGGEGQAKELYAVADLSALWVELTVSTTDLAQIREGQKLSIPASTDGQPTSGRIVFTSPLLNQDTRSARVIAEIDNARGVWRPGTFVTADVTIDERAAAQVVPKAALQTIEGKTNVFVRTETGFEARPIMLGTDDGQFVEVATGLKPGELVAVTNTFLLKADIGKSEAGHAH